MVITTHTLPHLMLAADAIRQRRTKTILFRPFPSSQGLAKRDTEKHHLGSMPATHIVYQHHHNIMAVI
jgi:hypothetical protein